VGALSSRANERDLATTSPCTLPGRVEGDLVTVLNIRNFAYRGELDYTPGLFTNPYDLRKLRAWNLVRSTVWDRRSRTPREFAFGRASNLPFPSRPQGKGRGYSTIRGLFPPFYELY